MTDYLAQVSIFESMLALVLILGANWAFTLIHILQEWKGEDAPLWRVFRAVVGVRVPDRFGFWSFTVALCVIQWLAGLMAIAGWLPIFGALNVPAGVWALGVLIGARIADSVVSHWVLYGLGYRPNPGLSSTALYSIEAVFLLVTFHKGLALHPCAAWFGFALGAGAFIAVLPLLRVLRALAPSLRCDPWVRGEPLPAWAKD